MTRLIIHNCATSLVLLSLTLGWAAQIARLLQ